jgi:hypothetical protein
MNQADTDALSESARHQGILEETEEYGSGGIQ